MAKKRSIGEEIVSRMRDFTADLKAGKDIPATRMRKVNGVYITEKVVLKRRK